MNKSTLTKMALTITIWLEFLLVGFQLIHHVLSLITDIGIATLPIWIPSFMVHVELIWILCC